ncbi:hypothetical protein ACWEJZ_32425 [Streptomyces bacillaris]
MWLSNTKSRRDKLPTEQRAALAALGMEWAGPAPVNRAVREHHEECDEELHEGGYCTCWSIKRFGPPSEREGFGDNL